MKHLEDQFFEYAAGEMDPIQAEKFWAGLSAAERAELSELKEMLQGLQELRNDVPECQLSPERLKYAIDAVGVKPKKSFWKWHPWLPAAALGSLVSIAFLVQTMRPAGLPPVPEGVSLAELDGAVAGSGPIGSAPRYEMPKIGSSPTLSPAGPVTTTTPPESRPTTVAQVTRPDVDGTVQPTRESTPRRAKRRKPQRVMTVADNRPVKRPIESMAIPMANNPAGIQARGTGGDANASSPAAATIATPIDGALSESPEGSVTVVTLDDQQTSVVQTATEVKKSNDVVIGS